MKRKIKTWLLAFAILPLLSLTFQSCSISSMQTVNPMMAIRQGQTQEEVVKLLGNPRFRRFNTKQEEWEWRRWYADRSAKVTVITFVDGLVVKMDSFYVEAPIQPIVNQPTKVIERPVVPVVSIDNRHRPTNVATRHSISDESFNQILKRDFSGINFTGDYLKKIRRYSRSIAFSCRQTKRLLSYFSFNSDKLKALRIVAPYIWDRENAQEIISLFNFFDQATAEEILASPSE